MTLRRLAALATTITLFHGSVAAGGSACSPAAAGGHAAAASGRDAAPMGEHGMATPHDARAGTGSSARPDTSPCEMPLRQHCCEVSAGCGVAVVTATAIHDLASDPPVAARIRESRHDAPASFAAAPEPPPPKA